MEKAIFPEENHHFTIRFVEAVLHSSIVSRTDRFGNITFVNKNFETISGDSEEELVGKTHKIINSGFHPSAFWTEMWRTISSGNIWHGEVCNRAKDGSIYWVDTFIYPYHNQRGELTEFFSIRNDITQRKIQTERFAESEVYMRAIVNSTSDRYFLLSPQGKLLHINSAGQENLTEYWDSHAAKDYEAALKKAFTVHPDAWGDFARALKGDTVELEVELERLNGEKRWHHVRHLPAYDDNHKIIGVSIVLTDIHRRKMQELKLRESESLNRAILDSTNDIYMFMSPRMKLLSVNQLGVKLLEQHWNAKTYAEIEARIEEFYQTQPQARQAVEQALNGQVVAFETQIVRPDTTTVWYQIRNMPAYDNKGKIMGVSTVFTDIHERKLQEAKLRESEQYYRAILNSTSDVYFLVDPQLKLLATNSIGDESLTRLVKTWSLPDKQTAFENVFRRQERFEEYFRRALAGEVVEIEHEVNRYDGTKVWYYHRFLPVYNDAKESIGVSISMTNIHTRKMQELEIEAKNRALMNIAWSQSHEMRRPVASILGLIQLRQAPEPMISEEEFITHLATMINELDEFIKKNVERTYLASQ